MTIPIVCFGKMKSNSDFICVKRGHHTSRRLIYFFFILHFILGLDFGFFNNTSEKTKQITKMYCCIHGLFVCGNVSLYISLNDVEYVLLVWILTMLFQHILNTVVLTFGNYESSFHNLQTSLTFLDSKLIMTHPIKLDDIMILACFLSVIYRILATYFFCTHNKEECVESIVGASIVFLQVLATDSLLIICFFIFYSAHLRLKIFIVFVRNNDSQILECLRIYKSIVDMVEKIKKPFDILVRMFLEITFI